MRFWTGLFILLLGLFIHANAGAEQETEAFSREISTKMCEQPVVSQEKGQGLMDMSVSQGLLHSVGAMHVERQAKGESHHLKRDLLKAFKSLYNGAFGFRIGLKDASPLVYNGHVTVPADYYVIALRHILR